jgi:4-amino-4-deoxy-L-arabinose transferase-like glycosyltransferase
LNKKIKYHFWNLLDSGPVLIPAVIAIVGVGLVTLLLLDAFSNILIALYIALVVLPAAIFIYHKIPKQTISKGTKLVLLAVYAFVFIWMLFNAYYASQHIQTDRDPATYATAAVWLVNNESLYIPKTELSQNFTAITDSSAGFISSKINDDDIHAQGSHLLPILLSLPAKILGVSFVFKANAFIGAIALLAVFGVARFFVRDRWALLAPVVLGSTLPMIYFTRDTYTEPLMMAFVFAGISLTIIAAAKSSTWLWAIAGITVGASALVRIDAPMVFPAFIIAVAAYLIVASKNDRLIKLKQTFIYMFLMLTLLYIGFLDITNLSSAYYYSQRESIIFELIAIAVSLIGVAITVFIAWNTKIFKHLNHFTKSWRGKAAFGSVIGLAVFLVIRPLWMTGYRVSEISVTGELQSKLGYAIDPARNYAEYTVEWLSWYAGIPLVIFGFIGAALIASKMLYSKNIKWVVLFAVVMSVSIFYFMRPNITPDQIWAIRRFLPVVIPGFIVMGVYASEYIYNIIKNRNLLGNHVFRYSWILFVILLIVPPIQSTRTFATVRTFVPQLSQVYAICDNLGQNSVVGWVGMAGQHLIMPTRALCGVESVRFLDDDVSIQNIQEFYDRSLGLGLKPYIGVYGDQAGLLIEKVQGLKPISSIKFLNYENTLENPPKQTTAYERTILLAELKL